MNGLQALDTWKYYFNDPKDGELGLLNAIQVRAHLTFTRKEDAHGQNIGNLAGLPFAPFLNDRLGRKWTLFLGCCCKSSTKEPESAMSQRRWTDR